MFLAPTLAQGLGAPEVQGMSHIHTKSWGTSITQFYFHTIQVSWTQLGLLRQKISS